MGWFTQENLLVLLARVLSLAFAVPVHEVAHAFVSDRLGDHTARNAGRLTLNPIKHFSPFGFLAMLAIGIGWAKPVPIDPRYYKNRRVGIALTAAAGPLSNLVLAFLLLILYKITHYALFGYFFFSSAAGLPGWVSAVETVFAFMVYINITLALFNLLPVPPLDGSRILGLVLPDKVSRVLNRYEQYIFIALVVLLFMVPRITGFEPFGFLGMASNAVYKAMNWLTGWVDWIALQIIT